MMPRPDRHAPKHSAVLPLQSVPPPPHTHTGMEDGVEITHDLVKGIFRHYATQVGPATPVLEVEGPAFSILLQTLQMHPNAEEKIGVGVKGIFMGLHPLKVWRTPRCWVWPAQAQSGGEVGWIRVRPRQRPTTAHELHLMLLLLRPEAPPCFVEAPPC